MKNYELRWQRIFENCESESNVIVDEDGRLIFYINQYVDEILRERKIGRLISMSPIGEENWDFAFPDFNYLFFIGKISIDKGTLFVIVDSEQEFDSGFERGLYLFDVDGSFKAQYAADQAVKSSIKVPKIIETEDKILVEDLELEAGIAKSQIKYISDNSFCTFYADSSDNIHLSFYERKQTIA